jgi:hypothetical protein
MTGLLDHAVETVRALPPDEQDDIARFVLQLAGNEQPVMHLTDEEKASFAKVARRGEAARREFASDEQGACHVGAVRSLKVRYTPSANAELGAVLEYFAEGKGLE